MMFWIITIGMALLSAAILVLATLRRSDAAGPAAAYDLQVYRDQMAGLERDVERGVVDPADAERTRAEIGRRILAADAAARAETKTASGGSAGLWAAAVVIAVVAGSAVLYGRLGAPGYGDLALKDRIAAAEDMRRSRPDQATAEAQIDETALPNPLQDPGEDYLKLVDQLRTVVSERPDDLQGLRLLAASERNLGNFAAARRAYGRYLDLRGEDATAQEFADLADMMILAAGGYVSTEAEIALARALQLDRSNAPARYYWGLMMSQTGRPDQAFRLWDGLLREGPSDAPWIDPIRAQIEEMAARAGVQYSLPAPGGALRGPSQADVDAAGEMSVEDRMQMIQGMVAGLSERLATEGGPPEEWARLITALGVLDRAEDALRIYDEAAAIFADDPGAMDLINRAGERAGVAN